MRHRGRYWHPSEEQAEDYTFLSPALEHYDDNRAVICSILNKTEAQQGECASSSEGGAIKFPLARYRSMLNAMLLLILTSSEKLSTRPRIAPKPKIDGKGPSFLPEPSDGYENQQAEIGSDSVEGKSEEAARTNAETLDKMCRQITVLKNDYDAKRKQLLEVWIDLCWLL